MERSYSLPDIEGRCNRVNDLIWRSDAIIAITGEPTDAHYPSWYVDKLKKVPPAQPDNDMIHLQKEQSYLQGWEEGREALRRAAIDAVEKESQVDGAYGYMDTKSIVDLLNDLPSAEPKKGRWEERSVCEGEIQEWQSARCSVCEKYHTTPYLYYFDNFNYCPNCGAKMEVTK